jgi:LysR family hca operon transcriptional activator
MELRHLRYFVAVAGNLTVAAERQLHTSQPSLSRQIWVLEDEVGATPYAWCTRHRTDTGEALCKTWLLRRAH